MGKKSRKRYFIPTPYTGRPAAIEIIRMYQTPGQLDTRKLDELVKSIEGAVDAAWTAAALLMSLKQIRVNSLPEQIGERLLNLSAQVTQENKPDWMRR